MVPKAPIFTRTVVVLRPPHSLNLGFQVFVFGKLFRGFDYYYQLLLVVVVVFLW